MYVHQYITISETIHYRFLRVSSYDIISIDKVSYIGLKFIYITLLFSIADKIKVIFPVFKNQYCTLKFIAKL
jgi:hypothetical protein